MKIRFPVVAARTAAMLLVVSIAVMALFSSCGPAAGLLRPNGVAVMPDNTLYIMDRGNYRVVHAAADGRFLDTFGRFGARPEDIFAGWDLASDAAGNLYLCDLARDENGNLVRDGAKVFSPQGLLQREIGREDYAFDDYSHNPYGLDVDDAGRVYLADNSVNTLRIFDAEGVPLATFFDTGTGPGLFLGLNDVVVDDTRGLVYASDSIASCIQQFALTVDSAGQISLTYRLTLGAYGDAAGDLSYPQYLAVDETSGQLYVNDMGNYRIQAFDAAGNWIAEFAPPGAENWQGMGLDVGVDGAVYIADALNNVIWAFEPDGRLRARIALH
jgi:sugar lactone lactonase YvrE